MGKIYFFLMASSNSTTTYSNGLIAKELKKRGYDVSVIVDNEEKKSILENPDCDSIFFQKTIQCPYHTSPYIKHLKNRVNLIHIDDDFQDLTNQEHFNTLDCSDLVLVGTHKHARHLKEYTTTPIRRFDCLLEFDLYNFMPENDKKDEPIRICWHQACADAYINDIMPAVQPLRKLMDTHGVKVELYGWHMGKDYADRRSLLQEYLPDAEYIPYVPYDEYIQNILPRIQSSHIYLASYSQDESRYGKSGFGLKRIMLLGVPVVVTKNAHFENIITDGVNGFLAGNEEEWYESMERLVMSKELRAQFGRNAREFLVENHNTDILIKNFINSVNDVIPVFS